MEGVEGEVGEWVGGEVGGGVEVRGGEQLCNKDTEGHWGKINGLTLIFKKHKCSS